jgi:hypothetical protein
LKGEENAEDKIKALDEMHQKYKFMEASLDTRWVSRIQCTDPRSGAFLTPGSGIRNG